MPTEIAYEISATATGGGRDKGQSKTEDGALDITFATPKEMGGSGDGNNPEQLFATGYAACFLGAMRHFAAKEKIDMPDDAAVTAKVGIGPRADMGFEIAAEITAHLPGMEKDAARALLEGGHKVCPYSHVLTHATDVTIKLAE